MSAARNPSIHIFTFTDPETGRALGLMLTGYVDESAVLSKWFASEADAVASVRDMSGELMRSIGGMLVVADSARNG